MKGALFSFASRTWLVVLVVCLSGWTSHAFAPPGITIRTTQRITHFHTVTNSMNSIFWKNEILTKQADKDNRIQIHHKFKPNYLAAVSSHINSETEKMGGADNDIGARSSQKEDGDRSYESTNDVQQLSAYLKLPFFLSFFMNQKHDSGATIKYIEWMKQSTLSNPLANSIPSSFIIMALATVGSLMAWIPNRFGVMGKLITSSVGKGAKWYLANLEAAPLITKAISAGIIALFGDYAAQWFAYRLKHDKRSAPSADTNSGFSEEQVTFQNHKQQPWCSIRGNYDRRRGLAVLIDGIFIAGPIMHFAYTALEKFIPTTGGNRSLAALAHCIADSAILDALFVANAILTTGIIEGYDFKTQVLEQFRNGDYLNAIKASWLMSMAFLPLEFVFFRFLPVSLRVLAVNITDIVWGSVISFAAHKSRGSTNPSHTSSVSSLQQASYDDSKLEPVQQPCMVAQPSM